MNTTKRRRRHRNPRQGIAVVEFALCAPILLLLGFGFISCGLMIQMRHNSRLLGHLAATDIFKDQTRDAESLETIETRYETMAADLGFSGLDISIGERDGLTVVTTTLSVAENSPLPSNFQFTDTIATETHVYAPLSQ